MDDAITQTIHLPPWYVGMTICKFIIQCIFRQLANLQNIEDTRLLEHTVLHEAIKIQPIAVFKRMIDMGNQLS